MGRSETAGLWVVGVWGCLLVWSLVCFLCMPCRGGADLRWKEVFEGRVSSFPENTRKQVDFIHGTIHGAIHGAMHGAMHGALHGAMHGALHGAMHGPIHRVIQLRQASQS